MKPTLTTSDPTYGRGTPNPQVVNPTLTTGIPDVGACI